MVRGHSSCPSFCKKCKKDCLCDQCEACHTCPPGIITVLMGDVVTGTERVLPCDELKHDCCSMNTYVRNASLDSIGVIFDSILKDGVMKIQIPSGDTYWAHKTALERHSEYFSCLISSKLVESQTGMVELDDPEVDIPDAVGAFLEYCYVGDYSEKDRYTKNFLLHAQVYVFAERARCQRLKAMALRKATSICQKSFFTSSRDADKLLEIFDQIITLVYRHTSDRSAAVVFGIENPKPTPPAPGPNPRMGEMTPSPFFSLTQGQHGTVTASPSAKRSASKARKSFAGDDIVRDGFRMLLAAYSATNLEKLRASPSFMRLHHSLPDFSSDLILFVRPGGDISTDENGILRIKFRMVEFSLEET
ncbi:hypothetical protein TWF225_000244 [Orbilia oligospora]|uniref:BTB domain-containing protein n=1 Tax=Orbilia oligospora TaxID=2813651 RepID=A0A8H2E3Q4_ORBOL|nr:hypothetical protein TWF225_000244 [Orbilia oligospora]KAF3266457.1 hypothetical protein TWF128_010857 [Orbilia oligospora]KAF3272210.1 hypothetical protein TWF217_004013 [Orbilia oligospora]KAF3297621.1 hypothetical protein TWF132_006034 [Orbilia oligospora]TGJ69882.1 hypothetical protein EYR41_005890 [Orbilia oligospora]